MADSRGGAVVEADLTGEIEDAALATSAAEGDVAAFEMLLRRYQDRVFALALRMLRDRAEAEDVRQEVFTTAWWRLAELTDPGAVRTWLFRIAHRRCLMLLRTRKDRRTDPTGTLPDFEVTAVGAAEHDGSTNPQRAAEAGAGVVALRRALAELPPPQRVVWLLTEVDHLSYAEVAQLVGATEQAVRGRLARARASLAKVMRAWR